MKKIKEIHHQVAQESLRKQSGVLTYFLHFWCLESRKKMQEKNLAT